MRAKLQKGGLTEILLVILGIIIVIFVLLGKSGVPGTSTSFSLAGGTINSNSLGSTNSDNSSLNANLPNPTRTSPYAGKIHLGSGNAAFEIQPAKEYITVENDGTNPVDITGWTISNGAGLRTYPVGGNQETFASDVVTIPQGTALISSSPSAPQDIVLKQNESAAVVTGSAGTTYPYKVTTFKENECTGYLAQQNIYSYSFSPSLEKSCVQPRDEAGSNGLDLTCQNYIESMQSCHTPKYNTVDNQGNACSGCVDGNSGLSNACVAYIQTHFSYDSCLANHENDPNFYGTVWHIYLGRSFELWASSHELITLYDASGKVVDYLSY